MATVLDIPQAHTLIDHLPADATWEDLMYEIYVKETIENGLLDVDLKKYKNVNDIKIKYSL